MLVGPQNPIIIMPNLHLKALGHTPEKSRFYSDEMMGQSRVLVGTETEVPTRETKVWKRKLEIPRVAFSYLTKIIRLA